MKSKHAFEYLDPPPPRYRGWWLFSWPMFQEQFDALVVAVAKLRERNPQSYRSSPKAKLLATIVNLLTQEIPKDPGHKMFRQGGTLGSEYTGWFRARFHARYRLFFRYDSISQAIVYVCVNSDSGLRKAGDRNDPYSVFRRMLNSGNPPNSFADLLGESKGMTNLQ